MRLRLMGLSVCDGLSGKVHRASAGPRSIDAGQEPLCRCLSSCSQSTEAGMTTCKAKDTYGYLGTESMALREQVERLTAALEQAAKAEGAEAIKVAGDAARDVAACAATLVDDLVA